MSIGVITLTPARSSIVRELQLKPGGNDSFSKACGSDIEQNVREELNGFVLPFLEDDGEDWMY